MNHNFLPIELHYYCPEENPNAIAYVYHDSKTENFRIVSVYSDTKIRDAWTWLDIFKYIEESNCLLEICYTFDNEYINIFDRKTKQYIYISDEEGIKYNFEQCLEKAIIAFFKYKKNENI